MKEPCVFNQERRLTDKNKHIELTHEITIYKDKWTI